MTKVTWATTKHLEAGDAVGFAHRHSRRYGDTFDFARQGKRVEEWKVLTAVEYVGKGFKSLTFEDGGSVSIHSATKLRIRKGAR